jgi:hypothetical protein
MERRETRLRRIRGKLSTMGQSQEELVGNTPDQHHHIGLSQKHYEDIGTFLKMNAGDPAILV